MENIWSSIRSNTSFARDCTLLSGVGRDIHVGDTIIGIKRQVDFEAAAPMVDYSPPLGNTL
jgi:argininosuccinate synthase